MTEIKNDIGYRKMTQELRIYIHIHFCVKKCDYCDFLSAPATIQVQEQYLHALEEEIRWRGEEFYRRGEEFYRQGEEFHRRRTESCRYGDPFLTGGSARFL